MSWKLAVEKGPQKGQAFKLARDGVVSIGRHAGNGIQIEDPLVSRQHCKVQVSGRRLFIEDRDSKLGTWVNYERVTRDELREGDLIQIGHTELWVLPGKSDPLLGKTVEGTLFHYLIGHGGEGVVYLAEQVRLGRTVAAKVLLTEAGQAKNTRENFLREARTMATLNHPNIVKIYDVIDRPEVVYYVMEHMSGGSLDDRILDSKALPLDDVLQILVQACAGLSHLHAQGFVHRDIKPGNFLLDDEGTLKIADFGITTASGGGQRIKGSPYYMAPEQIRGRELDARSDLYALGCTAFRLLTGDYLFTGTSHKDILAAHVQKPPPSFHKTVDKMPRSLGSVFDTLLCKDPDERPANASVLAEVIRKHAEKSTKKKGTARSRSKKPLHKRRLRRR